MCVRNYGKVILSPHPPSHPHQRPNPPIPKKIHFHPNIPPSTPQTPPIKLQLLCWFLLGSLTAISQSIPHTIGIVSVNDGGNSATIEHVHALGNSVIWSVTDNSVGTTIYRSDGAVAGTTALPPTSQKLPKRSANGLATILARIRKYELCRTERGHDLQLGQYGLNSGCPPTLFRQRQLQATASQPPYPAPATAP